MAAPVRATYRLQLTPDFTFSDAEALIPYLEKLGVSHLYLSPIAEAVPGSTHGYDVIDPTAVRGELGGRAGFEALREAAVGAGMGLVLDFVPNHAGMHARNERWQRTLAFGPHARPQFFDIEWTALGGKILLPFLGENYGTAVDTGAVRLVCEGGRLRAAYHEHRFALRPDRYAGVLEAALPDGAPALAAAYRRLDPGDRNGAEALRPRLEQLAQKADLNQHLETLQGPALHDLLDDQHWRLAHWRTARAGLNYRRFFQIDDLIAFRQEDDAVFADTHRLVAELSEEEGVDGVRVDHIDGMADPRSYLEKLRAAVAPAKVWVEKILADGEALPARWPVDGTTGYAFLNDAMRVLTAPAGEAPLTETYRALAPEAASFEDEAERGKHDVMATTLAPDRRRLAAALARLAAADYHTRDLTRPALDAALTEATAAFGRYRTYLPHDPETAESVLDAAFEKARRRHPFPDRAPYDFLKDVLLGRVGEERRGEALAWTRRFQQFTAPVAAKGVEDAAFYRYNRLSAHCEVGGEPSRFGLSAGAFHRRCTFRASCCPQTLLATATHDHKRGEDLRMRLLVLAEHPEDWRSVVEKLSTVGEKHTGAHGPHPADAYLFYQTLAARWTERVHDAFAERLVEYMRKACRESARRTRWTDPDEAYEADVERFVRAVTGAPATADALDPLTNLLAARGFRKSLSQLALKCLTPGVPDTYRGCELLDLSLVDPDNRRPVDYERRRALLDAMAEQLDAPDAERLRAWIDAGDERAKLFFLARLLRLRRERPALFAEGACKPLQTDADRWLAFARRVGGETAVAVVPRFPGHRDAAATLALPDALAGRPLHDFLTDTCIETTGAEISTGDLPLPWAVLTAESTPST